MGDYQARFCERLEGKFLRPTRPAIRYVLFYKTIFSKIYNMRTLDLKKIFRLYLPSLVFAIAFATYAIASNMTIFNILAGIIILLLIVNLLFQNILISRILGVIFLLGSSYMVLALLDDVIDDEATIGYLFGFLMILCSIALSVLLIVGYNKNKLEIIEH